MKWVCIVIMWSKQSRIEKSFSYSISYSYSNLKSPTEWHTDVPVFIVLFSRELDILKLWYMYNRGFKTKQISFSHQATYFDSWVNESVPLHWINNSDDLWGDVTVPRFHITPFLFYFLFLAFLTQVTHYLTAVSILIRIYRLEHFHTNVLKYGVTRVIWNWGTVT